MLVGSGFNINKVHTSLTYISLMIILQLLTTGADDSHHRLVFRAHVFFVFLLMPRK